jgi:hypothetical protein
MHPHSHPTHTHTPVLSTCLAALFVEGGQGADTVLHYKGAGVKGGGCVGVCFREGCSYCTHGWGL